VISSQKYSSKVHILTNFEEKNTV